jgi:PTH1 family peptidyl-tRNA hydrolase
MTKYLIIGLGNPLKEYEFSRHNCGYLFVDYLKEKLKAEEFKLNKNCLSLVSLIKKDKELIILSKPQLFMNQSGQALKRLKKFYKVQNKDIFICHDDSDLFLGNFKIQFKRGSAGHKGVESIIKALKTNAFYRIRIGVRLEKFKNLKAEHFILKNFSLKEREILKETFDQIFLEIQKILTF